MAQIFDIAGFDNICRYIEASKKSKFTVYRYGQTGYTIPVFECTHHDTCGNALQEFKNFATILNTNVVYKIILFDEMEETGILGESTGKKTKRKSGKFEALFIIDPQSVYNNAPQNKSEGAGLGFNPEAFKSQIVNEINKKNEESAILNALTSFGDRLKALEIANIEDDDDDEDEDELSGNNMGQMIQGVTMLANLLKGGQAPAPVINGTTEAETTEIEQKAEKVSKINAAIKTLYKHDKNLHETLAKLAEIAETKPDTFKFLLSNLSNL